MCKLRIYQVWLIPPFLILLLFFSNCANILPLSGGEKDVDPPKIKDVQIDYEKSLLHIYFDENIVLNNWSENFYSSPFLKSTPKLENKKLEIKIGEPLNKEETYLISLNDCIKDLNEGNVASDIEFIFSHKKDKDSLLITGHVVDAFSGDTVEGAWIFAYDSLLNDSLLFRSSPNYVSKSNGKGFFTFPNLKNIPYYLYALDGKNHKYENGERVAFLNQSIYPSRKNLTEDKVLMSLFDPLYDSIKTGDTNNLPLQLDQEGYLPSTILIDIIFSNNQTDSFIVNSAFLFHLIDKDGSVIETWKNTKPFKVYNVPPGDYTLKCILDLNCDKKWTTGNIEKRILPEITLIYPEGIMVRPDSEIELEWEIVQSNFINRLLK